MTAAANSPFGQDARACAEYIGTPHRRHRWQAVIKDADHGRVIWRGDDVHAAAITALVVAEDQLRRAKEQQQ